MTAEAILFVDDEKQILRSIERLFIGSNYRVLTTDDAQEALEIVRGEDVAVVFSDQCMPKMKGIELLERIKTISPDTVKILMTAYADLATAVEAINTGEVFRFITKPWDNQVLMEIAQEAIGRFTLTRSLAHADEATLLALAETIELKDPLTQGHCKRVAMYSVWMAESLGISTEIKRRIRFGAWLHDCGKIGVPESVLNYPGNLSPTEVETIRNHPKWGAEVVRLAHMAPEIINIVLYHHEKYDGTGYPHQLKAEAIPVEARIVSIADTYDAMISERPYKKKLARDAALLQLQRQQGSALDPLLTERFITLIREHMELEQ
jgi:putative two-component system response regulator